MLIAVPRTLSGPVVAGACVVVSLSGGGAAPSAGGRSKRSARRGWFLVSNSSTRRGTACGGSVEQFVDVGRGARGQRAHRQRLAGQGLQRRGLAARGKAQRQDDDLAGRASLSLPLRDRGARRGDGFAYPAWRGPASRDARRDRRFDRQPRQDALRRSARRRSAIGRGVSSSSALPSASASATARPAIWCASRNGTPASPASQSARSVAVAWPAAAAARIFAGTNSRSATIPAIAARLSPSRSCASNKGGLSSCKSLA